MAKSNSRVSAFHKLHVKGNPVVLFNAWDAGSARAIREAGARAIATSSWAMAEAHGYRDGEQIPLSFVLQIVRQVVSTVDAPVTVDFEGGYTDDNRALADNVSQVINAGAVGINFEDRVVRGKGLYPVDTQATRIASIRQAAKKTGVNLFINARTDLFLGNKRDPAESIDAAIERAHAYAGAGASGFFVPGLVDAKLIGRLCEEVELPLNVLALDGVPANGRLAKLGVARISYGASPYRRTVEAIRKMAVRAHS